MALVAGSNTAKHVYVSRDSYKERIKRDKETEKKRKADIWQSQENLINENTWLKNLP